MFSVFFRLPRLTLLAILVVLLGGFGALMSLGRQEDPTLIERFGNVIVTLPGADAERMEALIAEPLEAALMELPEINRIDISARNSTVQASLDIREDLSAAEVDDAWSLIRQQVEKARQSFPPGTLPPQIIRQYVGATTMVVALRWDGEGDPPLAVMRRLALDIEDIFQRLPDTELTDTFGLPTEEIRVVVDPDPLAAVGLSLGQTAAILAAADSKNPAGRLRTGGGTLGVEVDGEFTSIARLREVPLLQRSDGTALRLGDIATVSKAFEDPPSRSALQNGNRVILIAAYVSPNKRVDRWASAARKSLAGSIQSSPPGLSIEIVFDQSLYTSQRLGQLGQNLVYSALIVLMVLFIFMGWRAAIVCGLALPLTIGLVLIIFNVFGHPLHQMSVTGLVISLGLLIDNAIVVVDDMDQWRAKGFGRLESLRKSLHHLAAPLAASTLTTALAFLPIAMLPGSAGEFVGMIGLSVIYSIVGSFILAMTVVPAMAAWIDRERSWERGEARRPKRWWRDGISFPFISDGYRATVETVLRFPVLGLAIGIMPAMLGVMLVGRLPPQFFPPTERDQFQIVMNLPSTANVADTETLAREVTDYLRGKPGIQTVTWVIGEPSPRIYYNAINNTRGVEGFAAGWVQLDRSDRTRQVIDEIQHELRAKFPNASLLALPFEQGPPAPAPIELVLRGPDIEILNRLGEQIRTVLANTPGVTYSMASIELGAPTLRFVADEAAVAITGTRLAELAAGLRAELDGIEAGSVLEGTEELPVRLVTSNSRRASLGEIQASPLSVSSAGLGTPLSAVGAIELVPETAVITRRDGLRVNQILAYLDPYTLPAPTLAKFQQRLAETGFVMPAGYDMLIGGEAENSGNAVGNLAGIGIPMLLVMAGAIMLVFNSFRMMLLVMSTGVLSVCNAFIGVWLFNLPFGFNAILGALGLFGIAINGTIVVLSLLRTNSEAVADNVIAQREVVMDATRHILATTATTMGGFVPLLLSGDAFWLPLASGIAVGVAGSALLALYFAPAVFRIMTMKPVRRSLRYLGERLQQA